MFLSKFQDNYDIIHANTSNEGRLFTNRKRLLITEHGFPRLDLIEKKEVPFYKKELNCLQFLSREGVPIVTISKYSKNILEEDLDVRVRGIIYHGLLDTFRSQKEKTLSASPIILFSSRLVEAKKPFIFLEALVNLPKDLPYQTIIRGDGPLKDKMLSFISSKGLASKVRFIPKVSFESLPDLYNSADIYIHTSPTEPFGLTILEAMGLGLPVVVPSCGGAKEVAGESSMDFNPNEPREVAERIAQLFTNEKIFRKQSERSIKRATEFTWEKAAKEYLSIYNEIARKNS